MAEIENANACDPASMNEAGSKLWKKRDGAAREAPSQLNRCEGAHGLQHIAYQYALPPALHHSQTRRSLVPDVVDTPTMWPAAEQNPPAETAISPALQTVCDIQVLPLYAANTVRVIQLFRAAFASLGAMKGTAAANTPETRTLRIVDSFMAFLQRRSRACTSPTVRKAHPCVPSVSNTPSPD
jgi:hypothetical protein